MQLEQRIAQYKAIEAYRKRPLIVYATSTRAGLNAMMAGDVVREFIDQIDLITSGTEVDVLINSTGGDALTAWKLMSLLRERFKKVCVLVPFMAFSAATIFALGADEIVMHPHASLGPIDPQIQMQDGAGTVRQFAYEDVGAFLRFIADEVRITEQLHTSAIMERLFAVVDPLNVGAAKRASDLSTDIGERLLSMHMSRPEDKGRVRTIAENLNKSFFAHSDAVTRGRAKTLQLQVAEPDPKLEKLIWNAYCGLEGHMLLREPFFPLLDYLKDPLGRAAIEPAAPLQLPVNLPPQIQQQIMQQAVNNAIQASAGKAHQTDFSYVFAVCESIRAASASVSKGKMSAWLMPNGEVKLNMIEDQKGWQRLTMPPASTKKAAEDSEKPAKTEIETKEPQIKADETKVT